MTYVSSGTKDYTLKGDFPSSLLSVEEIVEGDPSVILGTFMTTGGRRDPCRLTLDVGRTCSLIDCISVVLSLSD